jgi:hypothetical protein
MRCYFFILFLVIFISPVSAKTFSADDMLNITLVDSAGDIPVTSGNPNITMQASGNFRGWVDIIGWKEMIRENGVDYVQGSPNESAVVAGDVSHTPLRSRIVTDYRITNCYWCMFDSLSKRIDVRQEGNETVAVVHAVLNWHETVENSGTSQRFSYADTADFEVRKKSPQPYFKLNPSLITAHIIKYNNSFAPKTVISVFAPNASKISVSYNGTTLIHSLKLIALNYTDNDMAFGDVSNVMGIWDRNGTNLITHLGDDFVINSPDVDINKVDIQVSTPYEIVDVTNRTVETVNMTPASVFNPFIWPFLAIMCVSVWFINKILKVSGL